MTNQELMTQAIANMTNEEKAKIFPPIERKNFVEESRGSDETK